jgi:hypothetical protein
LHSCQILFIHYYANIYLIVGSFTKDIYSNIKK